ncbi:MAG: response regulator [Sulfuritalea sp.]|nr:response regulator [Sulfuritalea sp.]
MIVDDERHIRNLIRVIVSSLGAEVVAEAADGLQALELYKQLSPDIVMLDINMPKMDGISALKEIIAINPRALVIMMTSLNAIDVVKECIDNGARNYILKNIPADDLSTMIGETWGEYLADIRAAES